MAPVLVTDEGLNDAVTPAGRPPVMLNGDVQEVLLPLKLTVTRYAAEPPGMTLAGEEAPTVTVLGFESVNVICARDIESCAVR